MTLFLASTISQTIDVFIKELHVDPHTAKVLYIPTAGDYKKPKPTLDDHDSYTCLVEKGFDIVPCELDAENRNVVKEKMGKAKIIVVGGGNTYYLLNHMNKGGFRRELGAALKRGAIYVGSSAGSCVCSPDISYVKDQDDPAEAKDLHDYTGLNLVDFEIYPHCIEPWYEENYPAKYLLDSHKSESKKIYLRDHQAILVKEGFYKIVSS